MCTPCAVCALFRGNPSPWHKANRSGLLGGSSRERLPSLCARSTVFAIAAESYKFEPISQHERRGNWVCFFLFVPPRCSSNVNPRGRHPKMVVTFLFCTAAREPPISVVQRYEKGNEIGDLRNIQCAIGGSAVLLPACPDFASS